MRGLRLGLLLAGTAVAVVLAARGGPVYAATPNDKVESLVPAPDTAPVPPPTAHDVAVPPAAAPAPAAQPAPAATVAPADQPAVAQPAAAAPALPTIDQQVADKLREILPSKSDRIIEKKSQAAVDAFYAARSYAPLWIDHGKTDDRAKALAAFLANVGVDGLDPADYPLPEIKADADAAALA